MFITTCPLRSLPLTNMVLPPAAPPILHLFQKPNVCSADQRRRRHVMRHICEPRRRRRQRCADVRHLRGASFAKRMAAFRVPHRELLPTCSRCGAACTHDLQTAACILHNAAKPRCLTRMPNICVDAARQLPRVMVDLAFYPAEHDLCD